MCPQFLFVDTNSAHKDHHPESLTSSTHGHNQTLTKETISIAVRNSAGKLVMESLLGPIWRCPSVIFS
jgi:hypothetical protein